VDRHQRDAVAPAEGEHLLEHAAALGRWHARGERCLIDLGAALVLGVHHQRPQTDLGKADGVGGDEARRILEAGHGAPRLVVGEPAHQRRGGEEATARDSCRASWSCTSERSMAASL
jgi:hypothetical protein